MSIHYGELYCLHLITFQVPQMVYSYFSVKFNEIPEVGKGYIVSSDDIGMDRMLKFLSWNSKHRAIIYLVWLYLFTPALENYLSYIAPLIHENQYISEIKIFYGCFYIVYDKRANLFRRKLCTFLHMLHVNPYLNCNFGWLLGS